MIDLDAIFRYKVLNKEKMESDGFVRVDGAYSKKFSMMQNQFSLAVDIDFDGAVRFKVTDMELGEEYALVHVDRTQGGFVGEVRSACERILIDISNSCFDIETHKADQTKRIVQHIKNYYDTEPEFLWEKTPEYAVFRNTKNQKWFCIVMRVDRSKLGLREKGNIEIMNLKNSPEIITDLLDKDGYYQAYHMNKKHWFTVCLDGSVSDDDLHALIASSYKCAK